MIKRRQRRENKPSINSRKYGQVKLRLSRKGNNACLIAGCVFITQILMIGIAYMTRGMAPGIIGGISVLSILAAGYGISSAARGFREREKNYITCKIGIVANSIIIALFALLFIRGLL